MSEEKWIAITSEKVLPSNIHFRNHTEYWACKKGIVFKIYFYNSYGGKNYSLAEHNDEKIRKVLRENNIDCMGEAGKLDAYSVIERPKPYFNK